MAYSYCASNDDYCVWLLCIIIDLHPIVAHYYYYCVTKYWQPIVIMCDNHRYDLQCVWPDIIILMCQKEPIVCVQASILFILSSGRPSDVCPIVVGSIIQCVLAWYYLFNDDYSIDIHWLFYSDKYIGKGVCSIQMFDEQRKLFIDDQKKFYQPLCGVFLFCVHLIIIWKWGGGVFIHGGNEEVLICDISTMILF